MTLPCVSPAPIIGLAYATEAPRARPRTAHFGAPPAGPLAAGPELQAIQRTFHPAAALSQAVRWICTLTRRLLVKGAWKDNRGQGIPGHRAAFHARSSRGLGTPWPPCWSTCV